MEHYPAKVQPSEKAKRHVSRVRKILVELAELQSVPERFTASHKDGNVTLTDRKTGRQSTFPLSDYQVVRRVLGELFA